MIRCLLFTIFLSSAWPALAQNSRCGPTDSIVRGLAAQFGEYPAGRGLDESGLLVTLFVNPIADTWTLTFSGPAGEMCLLANGTGWQALNPVAPDTKS